MRLNELKEYVYEYWQTVQELTDYTVQLQVSSPTIDQEFKKIVRQFGDLRKKATWEQALVDVYARFLNVSACEDSFIISCLTEEPKQKGFSHLVGKIVEKLGQYQEGFYRIFHGIWQKAPHLLATMPSLTPSDLLTVDFPANQEYNGSDELLRSLAYATAQEIGRQRGRNAIDIAGDSRLPVTA